MKYWIVWRLKCSNDEYDYIQGVYTDETIALNACNKNNKLIYEDYEDMTKDDINIINNDILDYPVFFDDNWVCSKIIDDEKLTELYFICIIELGGAESYGNGQEWLHICSNKQYAIDIAIDFFENEHNYNDECEDCIDDKCKKDLVKYLNKYNKAGIDCNGNHNYPSASFEIFRIKIE